MSSSLVLCATLALAATATAQTPATQPASDQAPAEEEPEDAAASLPAPAVEETSDDRAHHLGPGEGVDTDPEDGTVAEEPQDMAEGVQAPVDEEPPPPVEPTPLEPQPVPEVEECPPAPAPAEIECPPPPSAPTCDLQEQAQPLIYGGLATGGLGLFGAIGFFLAGTAERLQAQSLLDTSEAFAKVDDRYVVQDPGHDDVGLYEDHRATASVMSQLTWISVGVALAGATTAGTAFFLSHEAEACGAAD